MAKATPREFGMQLSDVHIWPWEKKKEPFKMNEAGALKPLRQHPHWEVQDRLKHKLKHSVHHHPHCWLSSRYCTQPGHPHNHPQSHAHSIWSTGARVWTSSGQWLFPSAELGSTGSQLHVCTHVYRQTAPMLGQPELKNRLRHMHNSRSRQILRHFLKTLPLLLWHSWQELHVSGPICKLPFNWWSWYKQAIPGKCCGPAVCSDCFSS